MKKLIVMLLVASMALSLCACTIVQRGAETPAAAAPAAEPEKVIEYLPAPEMDSVVLINAEVDGESYIEVEKNTSLTATAVAPEGEWTLTGWAIDGNEINGETGNTLRFSSGEGKLVEAIFHRTRIITCIDCKLQVIDAEGKIANEKLETLNFEADGTAHVLVTAEVPENSKVIGWKINGVVYLFEEEVKSFSVEELEEATTYQPIFEETTEEEKDDSDHIHTWYMKYNSTHHWKKCDCGQFKDKNEHSFQYQGEVQMEGTWKNKYKCTVCGYTKYTQVIN